MVTVDLPIDAKSGVPYYRQIIDQVKCATAYGNLRPGDRFTEQAGEPQRIVGYVNFKDIVSCLRMSPQEPSLQSILRLLPSFNADYSIASSLEQLIRDRDHMALVRDSCHTIVGMITLEDIVEELVGEIYDEYDRLPSHIRPTGSGWIIGGNASMVRMHRATGVKLPVVEKPVHTFNDWLVERLGRPAKGGDVIMTDIARIVVRKVRRQLVVEAQLSRNGSNPAGTSE